MNITLIFATNNQHKVDEIRKVLNNNFNIITLKEAGINIDIPEPYNTLQENASTKSSSIHQLSQKTITAWAYMPTLLTLRQQGESKHTQKRTTFYLSHFTPGFRPTPE